MVHRFFEDKNNFRFVFLSGEESEHNFCPLSSYSSRDLFASLFDVVGLAINFSRFSTFFLRYRCFVHLCRQPGYNSVKHVLQTMMIVFGVEIDASSFVSSICFGLPTFFLNFLHGAGRLAMNYISLMRCL